MSQASNLSANKISENKSQSVLQETIQVQKTIASQNLVSSAETQIQRKKNRFLVLLSSIIILAILVMVVSISRQSSQEKKHLDFRRIQSLKYIQIKKRAELYKSLTIDFLNITDQEYIKNKVNNFTDMDNEVYEKLIETLNTVASEKNIQLDKINSLQRKTISWESKLPKVKQVAKNCESEAAYAVVGAIQGLLNIRRQLYIMNNQDTLENKTEKFKNIILSEQQIIDCCKNCSGCAAQTNITKLFEYVIENGLNYQYNYPTSGPKKSCNLLEKGTNVINGFKSIKRGSCKELLSVLQRQPVIVSIDHRNWPNYLQQNFNNCGRKTTSYGLLVGKYPGDQKHPGYWLVRMPWSSRWGEHGYIKLDSGNTCGICNQAFYPF